MPILFVSLGGLSLATAFLQLLWAIGDAYPRSVPTWLSVPVCAFAAWQFFRLAIR